MSIHLDASKASVFGRMWVILKWILEASIACQLSNYLAFQTLVSVGDITLLLTVLNIRLLTLNRILGIVDQSLESKQSSLRNAKL